MKLEYVSKILKPKYEIIYQIEDKDIFIIKDATGRPYVAKLIDEENFSQSNFETLLKVDHPNVSRVIEKFQEGSKILLIMTYVKGETLYDYLIEHGPLGEDHVIDILKKLIHIFDYLHHLESGLIYRDIHPKNIMIHNGDVYLIDLDSTRLYKSDGKFDTVTIGVIGFIAPEQYGFDQSSVQSDIYGLGVLVYYLLTGKIPNFNANRIELESVKISKNFKKLLMAMTAFSRKDRPKSMAEVQKRLNRLDSKLYKLRHLGTTACLVLLLIMVIPSFLESSRKDEDAMNIDYSQPGISNNDDGDILPLEPIIEDKNDLDDKGDSDLEAGEENNENINFPILMLSENGLTSLFDLEGLDPMIDIFPARTWSFKNEGFQLNTLKAVADEGHVYIYVDYRSPIGNELLGMRFVGDQPGFNVYDYGQKVVEEGINQFIFKIRHDVLISYTSNIALELGDDHALIIPNVTLREFIDPKE